MSSSNKIAKIALAAISVISFTCLGGSALYIGENLTDSGINIRSEAEGVVLESIPVGARVGVLDDSDIWYQVAYNGQIGYVLGELLTDGEDGAANIGQAFIDCDTSANLRALPNTDETVLASLTHGTQVNVIGVINEWYLVEYGTSLGYIHPDYIAFDYETGMSEEVVVLSDRVGTLLNYAQQFIGTPYLYGGTTPSGFDCSGFVWYIYDNALGITLPRSSSAQSQAFDKIENIEDLMPGDLVFFGSSSVAHVGLYMGNGEFLHSPQTGSVIRYDTLYSGNYLLNFQWGCRIL